VKDVDIPGQKFPVPFGNSATGTYIRTVPETTADPVAASLQLGWPPATGTPVGAGGTPPDIRDENGILFQISAWTRWANAGGPVFYDVAFSTAIGGYPKGALLNATAGAGIYWVSTVDDNTSDPDTGGANWDSVQIIGLGSAAYKAASDNGIGVLASVTGPTTVGHLAVFSDTSGSITDGGPVPETEPVGTIDMYGGATPPSNYFECNGAAINRITYAALFTAIGTAFGIGDGLSTFNIPDFRGEFPRGWDNGRGVDPARALGSTQAGDIQSHGHYAGVAQNQTEPDIYGHTATDLPGVATEVVQKQNASMVAQPLTSNTGGSETRPTNVAVMFIIKYM
jgi:microcystin-dependent protein